MPKTTRQLFIVLICGLSILSADRVRASGPHKSPSHVRFDNDRIREVFEYAMKRSPSFGDLVATLELLDRVVYVEEGLCRHRQQSGCLVLMPTPGAKNLLVRIDPRQPIRAVVAQLAHELYHALEVAREPAIVDELSLRDLYVRIGERCLPADDNCWETRAAVAFEALVTRQLNRTTLG